MNSDGFIKIVELGSADVIKEAINTSGEATSSEEKMIAVQLSKREAKKRPALTPDQQARFLEATATSPHSLLFRFLLATGLRIGEALALTPPRRQQAGCDRHRQ